MSYLRFSHSASLRLLVAAVFFSGLIGCGGSAPAPPAPVFPNVTGNWQFLVGDPGSGIQLPPGTPIFSLSGSLSSTSTSGKVTGTLTALSLAGVIGVTPCISDTTDIQVSGTIDSAGNLSLTAPISGGVATLTAVVTTNPIPFYSGTYQVVGGPCAQTAVPLASIAVPNISGTYAGTLTQGVPQGTGSLTVKATLVESTAPNADGKYPLSGTLTYSGDCSGTFTLTNYLVAGVNMQNGPFLTGEFFTGTIPVQPTMPMVAFFSEPTGCVGIAYNGNLTRQ